MILDTFDQLAQYAPLVPHLDAALALCRKVSTEPAAYPVGKYEFEGGYLMVQEGTTVGAAAEGDFEAHKAYIDVQILLEGSEVISWADIGDLENAKPYQPDAWFFRGKAAADIPFTPGMACILFPRDGHKACRHFDQPAHYRKLVVKCPVNA